MESSVRQLETAFESAEAKMDQMEDKVDTLLKECNQGVADPLRASQIVKQFTAIKEEHVNILKEVEELKSSQQTAVKEILGELQTAVQSVETLKSKVGEIKQD